MTTGLYEERVLGAPDVCSNCFRQVKVERIDPTRNGIGHQLESNFERCKRTTAIGYGPADTVSEQKGVFCECGTESARHRLWEADDLSRQRFEELLKHLIRTVGRKGVTLNRQRAAAYALQSFKDGDGPDRALARGLEVGVMTAAIG